MSVALETLVSDRATIGRDIYALAEKLYPLNRSLTGEGVRDTLSVLSERIPLDVHEVASGTAVLDWTVPLEWNIRDAYVENDRGERVIDFKDSNLHVLGYSVPVRAKLSLTELKEHLFSLPDHPEWIPYRTSYYQQNWGFCMQHERVRALEEGIYEVVIDASLEAGHLTYGEFVIPGECRDEILLSAHICHPSLANDNLSGIGLLVELAARLRHLQPRYTYRFVFAPGTIGAICWLAKNEAKLNHIKHGLVVSCVGDGGGPTYKRSRRGSADIDKAMEHVLRHCGKTATIEGFTPYGYDERQYCSPGFNLPVGLFQRSKWGQFPEYHSSADNLDLVRPEHLAFSFETIARVIDVLENNVSCMNLYPKGEPQLGRHGLFGGIGGASRKSAELAMLWVLNLSDGECSLLDIAIRADLAFGDVHEAAGELTKTGLIEVVDGT